MQNTILDVLRARPGWQEVPGFVFNCTKYPKYWDTLPPYHTHPKILTNPLWYLPASVAQLDALPTCDQEVAGPTLGELITFFRGD